MRSLMACCHAAFAPPAAGLSQGLRSVSAWSRSPHADWPSAAVQTTSMRRRVRMSMMLTPAHAVHVSPPGTRRYGCNITARRRIECGRIGTSPTGGAMTARILSALIALYSLTSLAGAQTAPVERGRYLARAGDCISCHTAQGGAPFAGGYRVNTPFGYLLAPNITPDAQTGIGSSSADDLYPPMHEGVNRRGEDN